VLTRAIWRFVLLVLVVSSVPARAQDSRAEAIAGEQAEKAKDLKYADPISAKRWVLAIRDSFLEEPTGLYPYFSSVYAGGGLTAGAAYRRFAGERTTWDVKTLYSIRRYKLFEFGTDSLNLAKGMVDLHGRVGWREATEIAYHGLGIDSAPEERTNFGLEQTYVGGNGRVRPWGPVVLGAGLMYEDFKPDSGRGSVPSIETRHTSTTAPGLAESPVFLHWTTSAGIDWRPSAGYARRGGLYEVVLHAYDDRGRDSSFERLDANLVQHIPILRETWVVSLHGLLQTTVDENASVPYFMMPSLGGGHTLRAYNSWRFRDRHSVLMSAEWRWFPNRVGLDAAVFVDAGTMATRRADLDLTRLKSDVGVGLRFHGPVSTPLRIELAHGTEGLKAVFTAGPPF
jgi:hypothetical protein